MDAKRFQIEDGINVSRKLGGKQVIVDTKRPVQLSTGQRKSGYAVIASCADLCWAQTISELLNKKDFTAA